MGRGELMWVVATEPGVEIRVLVCQGWRRQGTPVSFLAIEVAGGGPATGGKVTGRCGGAASTGGRQAVGGAEGVGHQRTRSPEEEEEDVRRRSPGGGCRRGSYNPPP
jgi:hypothetical protein